MEFSYTDVIILQSALQSLVACINQTDARDTEYLHRADVQDLNIRINEYAREHNMYDECFADEEIMNLVSFDVE